ncbi:MAG: AhpC/TSA family protein [Alphaproteobacteria bacterium]|nr:MAG: AhpC/TSA family protein [Alphaproteobacteria bacterium]
MTALTPLFPRQPVPALSVPTVGGETWTLADQSPENFTMIVFYRGYHCPICSKYLGDLERKLSAFAEKGVGAVAISSDTRERAEKAKQEWGLENLALGYGLPLTKAREWGLYISSSRGKTSTGVEEPPLFIEPGLFLVRPDNTLYWASVQTMPFARPSFAEILGAVDMVLKINYPARGEVIDLPEAAE